MSGGEGGPCGRGISNRGEGDSEGFNVTGFGSSTCFFRHVHWKETSTRMQKPIGGKVDRYHKCVLETTVGKVTAKLICGYSGFFSAGWESSGGMVNRRGLIERRSGDDDAN